MLFRHIVFTLALTFVLSVCVSEKVHAKKVSNIVLVHGAFVDGSAWQAVHNGLQEKGYQVTVVQNAALSLPDDVQNTVNMIKEQQGATLIVGHSYGGVVISEAGNHDNVAGLVFVSAFVPDKGESIAKLIPKPKGKKKSSHILPPKNGKIFLDKEKFASSFAADIPKLTAEFMANAQVGFGVSAFAGEVINPAWKNKPSWYLLTLEDKMVPIAAQRFMAKRANAKTTEVNSSHAVMISNPQVVIQLIDNAAKSFD